MAGTVSVIGAKRIVSLCPMTPGCPRMFHVLILAQPASLLSSDFLPGRGKRIVPTFALSDDHMIDEHFLVSRAPELTLSSGTTFLLAGICLALQSYY
uniref:Uncharacterized protein n=1 Tax=Ailuropoda melanoleuca TaxID=9646 RepID=A0A7N5J8I7_AILME